MNFLVRYNRNGIELNEEVFQKAVEEFRSTRSRRLTYRGQRKQSRFSTAKFDGGTVELLVLRREKARRAPSGWKLGSPQNILLLEVCTAPALFD